MESIWFALEEGLSAVDICDRPYPTRLPDGQSLHGIAELLGNTGAISLLSMPRVTGKYSQNRSVSITEDQRQVRAG